MKGTKPEQSQKIKGVGTEMEKRWWVESWTGEGEDRMRCVVEVRIVRASDEGLMGCGCWCIRQERDRGGDAGAGAGASHLF